MGKPTGKRASRTYTAPARVRGRQDQQRQQRQDARHVTQVANTTQRSLATLKDALYALAESGDADPAVVEAQVAQVDETRHALSQLRGLEQTLARSPDLLAEARQLVSLAEQRATSMTGMPGQSRITIKESPTNSTPIASGNTAGVAWAGIGNRRTDAQGVPNAQFLRNLATKNPWVQAALTIRKQQIGRADIAIAPLDETKRWDKPTQRTIERLMNYPNEMRDSYRSLIEPVIDDILTLDRGCISKDLDARGIPHHLYYEDGATIKIYADWHGEPDKPHYIFQPPNSTEQTPLFNEQLICIMANAASYRFGLSPMQVLLDTVRADLAATEKASNIVRDVPPPHLIHLPGATSKTLVDLRNAYERDVAGRRELLFMGFGNQLSDLKVYPLTSNLKDSQFMEWQLWLARKICAVLQMPPQTLGITMDVNKATAEVQQDIGEDVGQISLLLLIEEYWNRELLADFAKVDRDGRPLMDALNLCALFPQITEMSRIVHADRVMTLAAKGLGGLPLLTPNMALKMLGEEPVPGGNTFWMSTKQGPIPWLSYDGQTGDYGTFATDGAYGGQTPDGGIDEDANDPAAADDTANRAKPVVGAQGNDAQANQAAGNESSLNGTPPDSGGVTAGTSANGNGNTSGDGATKAWVATLTPHERSLIALRRADPRRPGERWAATADTAHLARLTAHVPQSSQQGATLMTKGQPHRRTPRSQGHVPDSVAQTQTPSPAARQARTDLAQRAKDIFLEATARGVAANQ